MKVLIVDDEPISIKGIADYCEEQEWESKVIDFEGCYKEIMTTDPDVVVLDWCADPGDNSGMPVLESIWLNGYRPVVIFSGNTNIISLPEKYKNSGLVKMIAKGDEEPVVKFLEELKESHSALSSFRKELGASLIEAFKAIDPIQKASGNYLGDDVIEYLLARRAVNHFDLEKKNISLPSWAIYQYPSVISGYLSTGDIVRKVDGITDLDSAGSPDEYRIILTPSCDLVDLPERSPKVENVLTAECKGISNSKLGNISKKKKIEDYLQAGGKENELPLPAMGNILPNMIVDMKRLGTVGLGDIAISTNDYQKDPSRYEYVRICSIDSPFREQIVWTFLNNSGRVGVPDRDYAAWAESIIQ